MKHFPRLELGRGVWLCACWLWAFSQFCEWRWRVAGLGVDSVQAVVVTALAGGGMGRAEDRDDPSAALSGAGGLCD